MVKEVLEWLRKESREKSEEFIGVTTTFLALLTAAATLAGHRAHTEEIKFQTQATDQWGFYQAKHIRAHMYGIEAERALADPNGKVHKLAKRYLKTAIYEQCGEPVAESCNIGNCLKGKDTRACNVPVLKDSPELVDFFQSDLLTDDAFCKSYLPTWNREGPSKPCGEPVGVVQKRGGTSARKSGANDILDDARSHDRDVNNTTEEAKYYDITEIILETSIMICGIALVVDAEKNRKTAFLTTIIAVIVAATGVGVAGFALRYADRYVFGATIAAAILVGLALSVWLPLYFQKPGEPPLKKAKASSEP